MSSSLPLLPEPFVPAAVVHSAEEQAFDMGLQVGEVLSAPLAIESGGPTLCLEDSDGEGFVLPSGGLDAKRAAAVEPPMRRSAAGGNPLLMYMNHCKRAYKLSFAPSGRTMTQAELRAVEEQAREEWASTDEASRGPFVSKFRRGVRRRQEGLPNDHDGGEIAPAPTAYRPNLGIGTQASVIRPGFFCQVMLGGDQCERAPRRGLGASVRPEATA